MTTISIKADVTKLTAALTEIQRRQIPFATAQALTAVAKLAQRDLTAQLPSIFENPTPFTLRGIGSTAASKQSLTASVFVKDTQAKYLALEETGGTRLPAKRALVLPVDIRLNAYGNMKKGAILAALAQPNTFSGTVRGVSGIWERPMVGRRRKPRRNGYGTKGALNTDLGFRTGLTLLVRYKARATYQPKFNYQKRVRESVAANLPREFAEAMTKALQTARK